METFLTILPTFPNFFILRLYYTFIMDAGLALHPIKEVSKSAMHFPGMFTSS